VEGETSGPTSGAVPNAGGAPGGNSLVVGAELRHAVAALSSASDDWVKNLLREFTAQLF
jgi:hypothetical protein